MIITCIGYDNHMHWSHLVNFSNGKIVTSSARSYVFKMTTLVNLSNLLATDCLDMKFIIKFTNRKSPTHQCLTEHEHGPQENSIN